jgi:hypothetical protein
MMNGISETTPPQTATELPEKEQAPGDRHAVAAPTPAQ